MNTEITTADLTQWKDRIDFAREQARESLLDYAAECFAFKTECERAQGGSTYSAKMQEWYGIDATKASMLATVGAKRENFLAAAKKFPPGLDTLYLLCDVPVEVIKEKVTDKTTRDDARKLKKEYAPPKPPKEEKPAKPFNDGWMAALRAFGTFAPGMQFGGSQKKTLEKILGFSLDGKFDEATARKIAGAAMARWPSNGDDDVLTEKDTKRVERVIAKRLAELERDAAKALDEAAKVKAASIIEEYSKLYDEMKEKRDRYENLSQGLTGVMSKDDYKFILGCLHPDREADAERKARAFDMFRKLEPRILG